MLARAAAHSFLEIRAVKPAGRVSRTGCADGGCFSSAPLTAPGLRDLELNVSDTGAGADLEALSKLCSLLPSRAAEVSAPAQAGSASRSADPPRSSALIRLL